MRRALTAAVAALALALALSFSVSAELDDELIGDYGEFFGDIGGDISGELPEGVVGDDPVSDAEALTDWRYVFSAVAGAVSASLGEALPIFLTLCGLILLSAALAAFRTALAPKFADMISACSFFAVGAAAVTLELGAIGSAALYIGELTKVANVLFPLAVSLYAAGGNVAAASIGSGAFGIFLGIAENLLARSIVPFAGICTALAVSTGFSSAIDLRPISGVIKKTYTTALGFVMTLFCAVTAAQNAIAAGQDSLGLRAARFFAGSAIPVVGGSVSESMRTLAASVGILRKSIGVCGIVLIFLLFLPTLTSLLLIRTANNAASGIAAALGLSRESTLLAELGSVFGYIAAVLAAASLMFIFLLTLLVSTAPIGM